ncbi:leucine-rich repeat-containing protein 20 isoform X7 [Notamacropus eugenii]|uniref:leucine-rich repeat-containing protein 20 isoform X7 n=1 Tax=Notamacropus eugenii TaxID=9315 RepID=UPI003B67CE4D
MGGRADSRNSRTPACTPVAPEITLTSWPGSERPCPPSSFDGWRNRDLSKVTQCVQPWDPGKDCVCMLKKMGEAVARVARKVNETVENELDTLDLAECKLVSFPVGIYKVLRNVTGRIHLIILANNELQSLTSKFMTTFSQLQVFCKWFVISKTQQPQLSELLVGSRLSTRAPQSWKRSLNPT